MLIADNITIVKSNELPTLGNDAQAKIITVDSIDTMPKKIL